MNRKPEARNVSKVRGLGTEMSQLRCQQIKLLGSVVLDLGAHQMWWHEGVLRSPGVGEPLHSPRPLLAATQRLHAYTWCEEYIYTCKPQAPRGKQEMLMSILGCN